MGSLRIAASALVGCVLVAAVAAGRGRLEEAATRPLEEAESLRRVAVLVNCDDDDQDGLPDHRDAWPNSGGDAADLGVVELRRVAGPANAEVRLRLRFEGPIPVRIFGPAGEEILGPSAGVVHRLSADERRQISRGVFNLRVEGLRFAAHAWLSVRVAGGVTERVRLEVAPFIVLPHSQPALDAFVVRTFSSASRSFVREVRGAWRRAEVAPTVERSLDVWMQDEMQWGYQRTPSRVMPVVLHMHRQRPLEQFVRSLLGPDVGYFQAFDYPPEPNSLDYGGNLEVTPPVDGYPYGRIYLGGTASIDTPLDAYDSRRMHPRMQGFLRRQGVQAPIRLATDWLAVGHVDEIATFLPDRRRGGFALLLASPRRGLEVLHRLAPETPLDANYRASFALRTVGEMLDRTYLLRSFEDFNLDIDARIFGTDPGSPAVGSVKATLMSTLGLREDQVFEVPVLFHNLHASVWRAVALTPNVVNVASAGDLVLVGDPFLPELRSAAQEIFETLGLTVEWVDDWRTYHTQLGNVHCGTNERRLPFELAGAEAAPR